MREPTTVSVCWDAKNASIEDVKMEETQLTLKQRRQLGV